MSESIDDVGLWTDGMLGSQQGVSLKPRYLHTTTSVAT